MSDLLEEYIEDEKGRHFLKTVQCSSKLMLSLVHDILDYSQIKAGKFTLNLSFFHLRLALDEIMSMFEI
jgi:signal transduction histidine kinase